MKKLEKPTMSNTFSQINKAILLFGTQSREYKEDEQWYVVMKWMIQFLQSIKESLILESYEEVSTAYSEWYNTAVKKMHDSTLL